MIYFYNLFKQGQLYNQNVKVENFRVVQFDMGNITIQESPSYELVRETLKNS